MKSFIVALASPALLTACLFAPTGALAAALESETNSATVGLLADDNLSNGQLSRDRHGDTAANLELKANQTIAVGDDASIGIGANLAGKHFYRYDGLNYVTPGAAVSFITKLGLGSTAPRLRATLAANRFYFDNDVRDSWLYLGNVELSQRLSERWQVSAAYLLDRRVSTHSESEFPGFSGAAFDQSGRSILLAANYFLTDATALSAGLGWRRGDVTATTQPNFAVFKAARAIEQDSVFGEDAYAYKLTATVQTLNIGISKELGEQVTLNLLYARQITHGAFDFNYYNSQWNLALGFTF